MSEETSPSTPIEVVPSPQAPLKAPPTVLKLDAYYDCMRKCYWVKDDQRMWIPVEQGSIRLRLQAQGLSGKAAPGYMISEIEQQIVAIQDQRAAQYVGPLAGYKAGLKMFGNAKVLVTTDYVLIEAKKGEWRMLRGIIENMLNKDDEMPMDQGVYFFGWLHLARLAMVTGNHTLGQALVLCGPACCGKSLLQSIVTKALGGRSAKPFAFMIGKTNFNRETFGAEHMMIEDENPSLDMRARRAFGAQIKQFAATRERPCMGKHQETFSLTPFQRLSISLNDEPENVAILPPLDENMEDKLIILKAAKHPMPMPTSTPEEEAAFGKALEAEIPAFLWWLENEFVIPKELTVSRYGIKSFVHPVLLKILDGLAPHTRIMYLIDRVLFTNDMKLDSWKGTADDLQHALLQSSYSYQAKQMLTYPSAMGTFLGQLAKSEKTRVSKEKRGDGSQEWTIRRDPTQPVVADPTDFLRTVGQPRAAYDEAPIQQE